MGEPASGVILYANGIVTTVSVSTLEDLQTIVGGPIEFLPTRLGDDIHGYINEEGKIFNLKPNYVATKFFHMNGWLHPNDYIAGDCIILGGDGEGGEANVPPKVYDLVALAQL